MRFFKKYDDVRTLSDNDFICYCCKVDKRTIVSSIKNKKANTLAKIKEITGACTGNECKTKNPNGRCCSKEINQLIQIYG